MIPRLAPPRLLPLTVFALASLLAVKSAGLVQALLADANHAAPITMPGEAQAATPPATAEHKPASEPPPATPPPTAAAPAAPPVVTDAERAVLLELRHRRDELDAREAGMAARESVLAAAEQKIAARVTELQTLQKRLEELEAAGKQRENASWQGLVKLYEAMKPREAATIFNDLEMPVLLQVVDRMKEAKAAPILAAMHPDKARDVTTQLAQMRTHRDEPGSGTTGG